IGVLFTEVAIDERCSIIDAMMAKISHALSVTLTLAQLNQVAISFYVFPENWDCNLRHRPSNPILYPDFSAYENQKKYSRILKRLVDIVGSIFAIVLFAPIFFLVSSAIKLTS